MITQHKHQLHALQEDTQLPGGDGGSVLEDGEGGTPLRHCEGGGGQQGGYRAEVLSGRAGAVCGRKGCVCLQLCGPQNEAEVRWLLLLLLLLSPVRLQEWSRLHCFPCDTRSM